MNKKQLIDCISMRTDLPREDSKMALVLLVLLSAQLEKHVTHERVRKFP